MDLSGSQESTSASAIWRMLLGNNSRRAAVKGVGRFEDNLVAVIQRPIVARIDGLAARDYNRRSQRHEGPSIFSVFTANSNINKRI